MSSTYSPITMLHPIAHTWNTHHWPHVQYMQSYRYFRSHNPYIRKKQHWPLIRYVQSWWWSLYKIPTATYRTQNTDHMSSMLSPVTMLNPTTHIWNTQHWPQVQYLSPYGARYIRSQQPHTEHKTLTTCPVRSVQSLYLNIPPTYITNNTDHMSSAYSPITILDPSTHIQNKQHWPHVQYIYSYHYISHQHPHMKHTTLTKCPVRTVLSLYYISPPEYETNNTDHMSSTYSTIAILDPNTQISKNYWPHIQYVQSNHKIISLHPYVDHTTLTTWPVHPALPVHRPHVQSHHY